MTYLGTVCLALRGKAYIQICLGDSEECRLKESKKDTISIILITNALSDHKEYFKKCCYKK